MRPDGFASDHHDEGQITDIVAAPFAGADPAAIMAAPSINSVVSGEKAQADTASAAITTINQHLESSSTKSKRAWPDFVRPIKKRGSLHVKQGACGRQCSLECQQRGDEVEQPFIGPAAPQ